MDNYAKVLYEDADARVEAIGDRTWLTAMSEFGQAQLSLWDRFPIDSLKLHRVHGWRATDVNFLRDLPPLKALSILDYSIDDVRGIEFQPGLELLHLQVYAKRGPSLQEFRLLKELRVSSHKYIRSGLRGLEGLEVLWISGLPKTEYEILGRMTNLRDLEIAYSSGDFAAIGRLGNLRKFGLHLCRGFEDWSFIENLGQLVEIDITSSSVCFYLDRLSCLPGLRRLALDSVKHVASLEPLRNCEALEACFLGGKTNIIDGSVDALLSVRSLRNVNFMNRRHYKAKLSEVFDYVHRSRK